MAQANANEYWSENVKEHFHTPPALLRRTPKK